MKYNRIQKIQDWRYLGLLLVCIVAFSAGGYAQDGKTALVDFYQDKGPTGEINKTTSAKLKTIVALKKGPQKLVQALRSIARQAGLKLSYSKQVIPFAKKITIKKEKLTAEQALWDVLEGTGYRFGISASGQLVLVKIQEPSPPSQQETITGTVTDAQSGETLPGVNILVKGTSTGTSTNENGTYELTVESLQDTLVFSFVGYQTRQIPITGRTEINVKMTSQAISGQEMVVIGYGEQKRSSITGSISSIKTKDLGNTTSPQVNQLLQGKAAGLRVTRNGGAPGGDARVRIRGLTSITGNNPLYVVDGTPTSNIGNLNPSDIKSVEVLKDASATAIYGARGADGVIMLTTKKGKSGETKIHFDVRGGITKKTSRLNKLNSSQYMSWKNQGYINQFGIDDARKRVGFYTKDLRKKYSQINTNWMDKISRPGYQQDYNLNISGGADNFNYYLGGSYTNEKGIINQTGYNRYTGRINTNYKANDWLTTGENISFSKRHQDQISRGRFNGIITLARTITPFTPVRDPQTGEYAVGRRREGQPVINPLAKLANESIYEENKRFQGDVFLRANPIEGLDIKTDLSFDRRNIVDNRWQEKSEVPGGSEIFSRDQINYGNASINLWDWKNTFNYKTTFADLHNFNILGGLEIQAENTINIGGSGINFLNTQPFSRYINTSLQPQAANQSASDWGLWSYFGRLNYNFDMKYYLTASIRRDGSSRFGPDNRWGTFGSLSGAWRIGNETFMNNVNFISKLKLRAGWGVTGDQSLSDPYPYVATLGHNPPGSPIIGFGEGPGGTVDPLAYYPKSQAAVGVWPNAPVNPNLGWEQVSSINVGTDLGLIENKILVTVEYYKRTTTGMLVKPVIPSVSGFTSSGYQNLGKFLNVGLDFDISYTNHTDNFSYSVGVNGNLPFVNNRLVNLGGQANYTYGSDPAQEGPTRFVKEGKVFGAYYGFKTDGIFQNQQQIDEHASQSGHPSPGDFRYKDVNQDGKINGEDKTFIGTPYADITYGFNIHLNYKDISLDVDANGNVGREILSDVPYNTTTAQLDRWTKSNTNARLPKAMFQSETDNARMSDFYIHNGSYLRIQNVSLGYSLSSHILSKTGISHAKIYIRGANLLTFTGYKGIDPEVGGSGLNYGRDNSVYPYARTYSLGLSLTF